MQVKLHSMSFATPMHRRVARRSMPVRMAVLAMAVVFTASQVPAQPLMDRDATSQIQTTNAQAATTGQGDHAAPAAEDTATAISAPAPNFEEAALAKPFSDSLLMLAAQGGTSNSSVTPSPSPKAVKTKPSHHRLGVALAITGTAALVIGVVFAAGADHINLCSNEHTGGCQEARSWGYAGIGVGAPVAVLGYYLLFHK